jgi:hypothetical protein
MSLILELITYIGNTFLQSIEGSDTKVLQNNVLHLCTCLSHLLYKSVKHDF